MKKKVLVFSVFFLLICSAPLVAQDTFSESRIEEEDIEAPDEDFLKKVKNLKARKLTDLVYLSPFSDVSVIQRRFMPKTGRVYLSLLSVFTLSSEFFLHTGAEGHLTYHFLEKHGVELSGYYIFSFNRGVTTSLVEEIRVNVSELQPIGQSFFGLTYKWMPIYGKITLNNRKILAFDTFFNIGGGMSGVNRRAKDAPPAVVWEPTGSLGVGQVFAITRDLGLRWDLKWHLTLELQTMTLLDNILFSVGLSYYYPSAGLR